MSEDPGNVREFTVDELAARAGMTVRNVRAYASRGLIAAPRLEGRTGYYNHEHLQRLHLIRVLMDRGYTLASVEKNLLANPLGADDHALDLIDVLHSPTHKEEPELMTRDALAALAGVPRDDALIENLADLGLTEWIDEDRVKLLQPAIVRAGAAAVRMGLSPQTVLAMLPILREHLGPIADHFVDRVRQEVWQPFADAGMPETDWPTVLGVIESLLPVAGQAVLTLFREQLAESIDHALGEKLALADKN